jgi:hypothetical protein
LIIRHALPSRYSSLLRKAGKGSEYYEEAALKWHFGHRLANHSIERLLRGHCGYPHRVETLLLGYNRELCGEAYVIRNAANVRP